MTFAEIKKDIAALELRNRRSDTINAAWCLICSAEENVLDMIHIEKNADEAQWDALCLSTLEGLLCNEPSARVRKLFTSRGVTF